MTKRVQPSMKTKSFAYAKPIREPNVTWECPKCGRTNYEYVPEDEITGGCMGHGPGEYCYCASRSWRRHLLCDCGEQVEVVYQP